MLPELGTLNLGALGTFTLRTYSVMLTIAALLSLAFLAAYGSRAARRPVAWLDAGLAALVAGVATGRLGHAALHYTYFAEHPQEILQVWQGGLDWHAGVLGGLLAGWLACRFRQIGFREFLDIAAFVLAFGAATVYAGCWSTSCGHGREVPSLAQSPWWLVSELPDIYGVIAPRLNSQLYGLFFCGLLLVLAAALARLIDQQGARFWMVLGFLGLIAFGVGFTRGDDALMLGGLRIDQVLDLAVVAAGIAGLVLTYLIPPRQPQDEGRFQPLEVEGLKLWR